MDDVQDIEARANLVDTLRTLVEPAEIRRLAILVWPESHLVRRDRRDLLRRWKTADRTAERAAGRP